MEQREGKVLWADGQGGIPSRKALLTHGTGGSALNRQKGRSGAGHSGGLPRPRRMELSGILDSGAGGLTVTPYTHGHRHTHSCTLSHTQRHTHSPILTLSHTHSIIYTLTLTHTHTP